MTSCRAVLLPRFGGPEVLELRDNVIVPDLKPNEVLVRARAVSVNPLDCRVSFCYLVLWLFHLEFRIGCGLIFCSPFENVLSVLRFDRTCMRLSVCVCEFL